jgi:hypothetical protein
VRYFASTYAVAPTGTAIRAPTRPKAMPPGDERHDRQRCRLTARPMMSGCRMSPSKEPTSTVRPDEQGLDRPFGGEGDHGRTA